MPIVPEAHREKRRMQILQAAFACFSRRSFHRTSIQDICREAKLSPGAIYTYFRSKEELVKALAKLGRAANARLLNAVSESPDEKPGAVKILELLKRLRGGNVTASFQLDVRMWAEALDSPQLLGMLREAREETIVLFESALEINPGAHPRPNDRRPLALLLVMLVAGFEAQKALDPELDVSPSLDLLGRLLTQGGPLE